MGRAQGFGKGEAMDLEPSAAVDRRHERLLVLERTRVEESVQTVQDAVSIAVLVDPANGGSPVAIGNEVDHLRRRIPPWHLVDPRPARQVADASALEIQGKEISEPLVAANGAIAAEDDRLLPGAIGRIDVFVSIEGQPPEGFGLEIEKVQIGIPITGETGEDEAAPVSGPARRGDAD